MESTSTVKRPVSSPLIADLISLALQEDLSLGDVTSELTIEPSQRAKASIRAKEDLVVCGGGWLIEEISAAAALPLSLLSYKDDGERVRSGGSIAELEGSARTLLSIERTVLNFLQHLSAIATHVDSVMKQTTKLMVLDTRKTLPGYRILEKYAVRVGGARNHRMSLGDMILIKDNHIAANGGDLRTTLVRVFERKAPYMPVEVEVTSLEEIRVALEFPVQVLLLDNMDDVMLSKAVTLVRKSSPDVLLEASGRVTQERFATFEKIGIDTVSMGALTYGASHVDISMDIVLE